MKYLCSKFTFSAPDASLSEAASDILAALLGDCGYETFEAEGTLLTAYIQEQLYSAEAVDALIGEFPVDGVAISYQTAPVADQDWNAAWEEEGFSPISVAKRITVFDARHTSRHALPEVYADTLPIFITATNAFGTATHHTTQMMLQSLTECPLEGCRVLDCGCGTGILAIAAMKLGAAAATAYDIDEWSTQSAKANAADNGTEGIDIRLGDVSCLNDVEDSFSLIMANINRNIILSDLSAIAKKATADATLLLSGFLTGDVEAIESAARQHGFKTVSRLESGEWACLRLSR